MRAAGITAVGLGVAGWAAFALASPATAQEAPQGVQAPADSAAVVTAPASDPAPAADAAPAADPAMAPAPAKAEPDFTLHDLTTYGALGVGGDSGHAGAASGQTGIFTGEVGVRVGPYFGLEADGATSVPGSTSGKKLGLVDRYAGYIVGYWPLTKHFDLFAKLGLGHSRYKYEDGGPAVSQSFDSVNWGVGAQYFFSERDGVRTEILQEDYRNSRGERNSVNISWVHRFF
jgi:hypothetical protein